MGGGTPIGGLAPQLGLGNGALRGIRQQVVVVTCTDDAGAGDRQSNARRVDRDPATPPLLGDVCRSATAAGWVEDQVARVGRHEDAALDRPNVSLDHIANSGRTRQIRPQMVHLFGGKIGVLLYIARGAVGAGGRRSTPYAVGPNQPPHTVGSGYPTVGLATNYTAFKLEVVETALSEASRWKFAERKRLRPGR